MSDLFEALRLFITNTGSRSRLEVGGDLDVATTGAFADHLALLVEAGTGDVAVDMALVSFCDAATLRVLVAVDEQLGARGRNLRVVNASRPVVRLLQLAGLDATLLDPVTEATPTTGCPHGHHDSDVAAAAGETHRDRARPAPQRFAG
jgi:anti-sigma B factor antagonist